MSHLLARTQLLLTDGGSGAQTVLTTTMRVGVFVRKQQGCPAPADEDCNRGSRWCDSSLQERERKERTLFYEVSGG